MEGSTVSTQGQTAETTTEATKVETTETSTESKPESKSLLSTGEASGEGGEPKGQETTETPEYKISLPEGVTMDESLLKEFVPIARELKLDDAGAQKFVDLYLKGIETQQSAAVQAWEETIDGWKKSIVEDKALGGENLKQTQQKAHMALKDFFAAQDPKLSAEFQEAMDGWLGNHPFIVRFAEFIGRKFYSEDNVAGGFGVPGQSKTEAEKAQLLYHKSRMNP